jgi:hypothetical protein
MWLHWHLGANANADADADLNFYRSIGLLSLSLSASMMRLGLVRQAVLPVLLGGICSNVKVLWDVKNGIKVNSVRHWSTQVARKIGSLEVCAPPGIGKAQS